MALLLFSCGRSEDTGTKEIKDQISLRPHVKILVEDSAQVSPLVDSLKKQFSLLSGTEQINILGELAENWRANTFILAQEEEFQSVKHNYPKGTGSALCKYGVNYVRKANFDSAAFYLDSALKFSQRKNLPDIEAEAYSWKAEIHRQLGENDKCIDYQNKAIVIANKIKDTKRLMFCSLSKGEANRIVGNYDSAIVCYNEAIRFALNLHDNNKITIAYNGLAEIFRAQNNYPKSLEYYNKGMAIAERNKNSTQIAFCLNGMGDIYNSQKDFKKAISCYEKSYAIAKESGLKIFQCNSLSSLGMTYFLIDDKPKAIEILNQTVDLAEEIGNQNKLVFALGALGNVYRAMKDYKKAEDYFLKALNISVASKNNASILNCHNQLGTFYTETGKHTEAKAHSEQALELAKKLEVPGEIKNAAANLSDVYEQGNDFKGSLKMLRLFILMRDSINNEANIKQLAAVEYQAKEEGLKAQQKAKEETMLAQQAQKEEELKRQKTIRYAFTIGFALVLVLVIVVYKNLRENKRKNKIITAQKKEVEHQKELVEEKNKEITDSINYAKRLQEAILPPVKMVKEVFSESFILYLPKDIVAGDFYWMERIGDLTFFAAADSTGHGVPGSIVSVVCSNALNRTVKEFKFLEPGKILDKTRELVLETFEKSEGDVKDGMDVSLLCFNSQTKKVTWAGANNPLWYVSNGVVNQIKANKQPIGKTDNPLPFSTHEIAYEPGTIFYLITDGYADQFGGPKGKKFKYKQLEEFLLGISSKEMEEQSSELEKAFNDWKGAREQVDDVTIIGLKL
ncbi:MAG: protein serine/threonine phosphatase [Bacteroidetes bacterium]|jgi:tetratricopeptide (TPR) repeat protein|nr:protein serine/threonine phosphatase [Bacteroidota bacterium]